MNEIYKLEIFHNDIKPANIVLVENQNLKEGLYQIKLIDFGVASNNATEYCQYGFT